MGIVAWGKSLYESETVQTVITVLTVGMAIFSMVNAIIAFTSFEAATDNYHDIIGNWEKAPITDIYLNTNASCADGYTLLSTPKFQGTYSGACACPTSAYSSYSELQYSEVGSTCDANQTSAGCQNQPTIDKIKLDEWRGVHICFKREGKPQLISTSEMRPIPKRAGVCGGNYKACGSDSTYDKERTVCVHKDDACPVTGATTGTSLPSGYNASFEMATGESTSWFKRFQQANEMPINAIDLVLYDTGGKRGNCFNGGENQESYGGKSSSYTYSLDYPIKCSKSDSRWIVLDSQDESDYLSSNFADESSCLTDTDVDDYVSTGNQCGTSPTTDTDCMMFGKNSMTCGDDICRNVYYQSNCGALTRFAEQSSLEWAVLFRREIYWNSECDVDMLQIKAIEKPIEDVSPALGTNLAFNIIGNFFVGMFFPICILMNKKGGDVPCIPGDGEYEKKLLEWNKKYLNLALSALKLIPAIVALIFFGKIARVISRAAEGDCADSDDKLTVRSFTDLDEEVSSSIDSLTTQVVIDCMNIAVAIVMAFYANMTHKSSSKVSPEEGEEGGEKEGEKEGAEKGSGASPVEGKAKEVEMVEVEGELIED